MALLLFASASAAVCTWTAAAWNDGALEFGHPDAPAPLARIDAGSAWMDETGFHEGSSDPPAVALTFEETGPVGVLAADESVAASGVAALPLTVLHPASVLQFGPLVSAQAQHTVRLVGVSQGRPVVEPQLPPWFVPTARLAEAVDCDRLVLSIRARELDRRQKPVKGSLDDRGDLPVYGAPGGKPLATVRCVNVGAKDPAMAWEDYDALRERHCPGVAVIGRRGTWRKIRVEAPEVRIEGWVAEEAIVPEVPLTSIGYGGLGTRPPKVRCGPERLHVQGGDTAFPIAVLTEGAVLGVLRRRNEGLEAVLGAPADRTGNTDGWAEVEVKDAEWLEAIDGWLLLAPEALARCVPAD